MAERNPKCRSDMEANIDSDHFPLWAHCRFKLKKIIQRGNQQRKRIEPLPEEKEEDYNKDLMRALQSRNRKAGYMGLCEALAEVVPKHFEQKAFEQKRDGLVTGIGNTIPATSTGKRSTELGTSK